MRDNVPCILVALLLAGPLSPIPAADPPPVVRVAQSGEADFTGGDDVPIRRALQQLKSAPGTVEIGPGDYLLRRPLILPTGATLRGSGQTTLRLPPPTVVREAAPAGQDFVLVADTRSFAPDTRVQIALSDGKRRVPGDTQGFPRLVIAEVRGDRLVFAKPLPCDVPRGSGLGYDHNMIEVRGPSRQIRVERLILDGGRTKDIPMPGHADRCAVFAQGKFGYAQGPLGPPVEDLEITRCTIRNCYGRAVAFYSVVRSKVTHCLVEDIADESIDLDHFSFHCEVSDNTIRRGETGVTINDGSYCLVARNRIEDCGVGVTVWWWHMCPQENVDVENVIRDNTVLRSHRAAISLGKRCYRNQVVGNTVDGKITVVEADNTVRDNPTVQPPARPE